MKTQYADQTTISSLVESIANMNSIVESKLNSLSSSITSLEEKINSLDITSEIEDLKNRLSTLESLVGSREDELTKIDGPEHASLWGHMNRVNDALDFEENAEDNYTHSNVLADIDSRLGVIEAKISE